MTQERFLKLLNNPELLANIPYEELKTLTLAYPFAHNLRILLAIKARQEGQPDTARQLAVASAYSLDRKRLMQLMAPKQILPRAVQVAQHESVLELKPIEDIKKALGQKQPAATAQESENRAAMAASTDDRYRPEIVTPPSSNAETDPAFDEPRVPFFNLPNLSSQSTPPVEEASKAPNAQELAERSVKEKVSVASETLARLYAAQGFKTKAIAMYERLSLQFPEKSSYFAAEIDKLKN
jgi:hypothetical protein